MGEGILITISLGGRSKDLGWDPLVVVVVVVQGLGLPGSSSHLNGTEAEVWSGEGTTIPGGSGGIEKSGSLGVELGSDFIPLFLCARARASLG